MNKNKELAKNTIILTVGKICTQFVSFLLLPLYTALLLPEEYGIVDLFHTYVTLLVPVFNWQFENGLFRFMLDERANKDGQKTLFSTVIISNFFQSLIYIVFFLIAQNFISSEYKIFLAIDVVINIFLNTLLQFPRGRGDNTTYAIGSFLSATITVVFNVLFIAVFKMGAYGMFIATVLSKLLTVMYLAISQHVWEYFSVSKWNPSLFKSISKYSLPLVPNQLSWWVVNVSDRTIISYALGLAANGIYTVANKFPSIFITFYNIFNLSWTESVSLHLNDDDSSSFLTDTINTMFRLFSSICIGIVACMPFAFPIIINSNYNEAYYQIPILMIAVMFRVVIGLYSAVYVALKKSVEIAKTSFYSALINVLVNIILIKFIGLYAASISTLVAFALMAIYRYFHVKKYVDIVLERKILILTALIILITTVAYYSKSLYANILALLIVVIYAVIINRKFLSSVLDTCLKTSRKLFLKH